MSKNNSGILASPWFLLITPSLLIIAAYYLLVMPVLNAMSSSTASETFALEQQRVVDARISGVISQVETVARSQAVIRVLSDMPAITDDLESAKPDTANTINAHWKTLFSDAERFAILPYNHLGHAGMGAMGDALVNNIERDLVSQAVKKGEPQVDIYLIDNVPVFSVVAPVVDVSSGTAQQSKTDRVGVVFISWQQDWIWSLLAQEGGEADENVVSRLVLTKPTPRLLASANANSDNDAKSDVSLALQSLPYVNVEVSRGATSITAPLMGIVIAGTCALLSMVGLSLPVRREAQMVKKINADADKMTQYVASSLREKVIEPKFEFDANRDMANSLRRAIEQFKVDNEVQGALKKQLEAEPDLSIDELSNVTAERESESSEPMLQGESIDMPAHIFRAYDVRGNAESDLTDQVVAAIAKAFAGTIDTGANKSVVVGRDGRLSSDRIASQVVDALHSVGCDVFDIGLVPTPVAYHAAIQRADGNAIMVTASHNPPEDNGLKFLRNGQAISDKEIQTLMTVASANQFELSDGSVESVDAIDDYVDAIADDVVFASPTKVVIDCGNGAASEVAPILFAALGAEVIPLYADVDGSFPNRSPATRPADLSTLCQEVVSQGAELGIAFDGDADRLVAVTPNGQVIKGDHLLMLFAKDILTRHPGADVVFDVKCSKSLTRLITSFGGRPIMARSGHSWVKQSMRESSALLGGEFTGHFMFNERWFGFDDGLYAAARLVELLTLESKTLDEALQGIPTLMGTDEIEIAVEEDAKFDIVKQFAASPNFTAYDKSLLDGVRVDFTEGWGLLRASNTGAKLIARFEAETEQQLQEIVTLFDSTLKEVNPSLGVQL